MTTTINRVNGVYEREVAVHMNLVANEASIIYTNAATDPYTNNSGSTMLGQNQSNLDSVSDGQLRHWSVFSTGGGGVAYLGVICSASNKAQGVTGPAEPVGDRFAVDYVAHEMGPVRRAAHTYLTPNRLHPGMPRRPRPWLNT